MTASLEHASLYRLPWSLVDNAITWLEPTTKCNLYCEGCYRENNPAGHKPLAQVIADLQTVKRLRKTDGISIAGGEPLIYPQIVELVRYVRQQGWKPIVNSNGQALTPELMTRLHEAGVGGFTFHVDSHQRRAGWQGKSEAELNALRLQLAQMVYTYGKGQVACALNATIYRDTLDQVPMLTNWAQEHSALVNTMVYILFRSVKAKVAHNAYAGGEKVDLGKLVYVLEEQDGQADILAPELVAQIRTVFPAYQPCAYLNGTEDPAALKWLVAARLGGPRRMLGCVDPKAMEWAQTLHHLRYGTYLAYMHPGWMRHARWVLPLGLANRQIARLGWEMLKDPAAWFAPLHMQAIMVIQPCDVLPDGRQSMCDGCPDALPYQGRLVWSCRVDELEKYGTYVSIGSLAAQSSTSSASPGQCSAAMAEPSSSDAA
jgi:hypothetical protein